MFALCSPTAALGSAMLLLGRVSCVPVQGQDVEDWKDSTHHRQRPLPLESHVLITGQPPPPLPSTPHWDHLLQLIQMTFERWVLSKTADGKVAVVSHL